MKRKTIIIELIIAIIVAVVGIGVAEYIFRGRGAEAINASELSVGEKYLAELEYEKATVTLEQVIKVEPNNTEAYLALAKTYSYMGDFDAAVNTLESGLEVTGSTLIQRALDDLKAEMSGMTSTASLSSAPIYIELGGRMYPSDAKELVLRECGLSNADLQKLTEFKNLEWLDISGNEITDISEIAKITTLKKFYAANNAIVDIYELAALPSIEYIGLRGNQITDADALFDITSLKYLHLSDNQITSVTKVGENLQLLYLANNKISQTSTITEAGLLYYDISGNAGR